MKIGLLLPLTGQGSTVGRDMQDAALMAMFDLSDGRIEFQQAADGKTYTRTLPFTGSSVKVRITVDGVAGSGSAASVAVALPDVPNSPQEITRRRSSVQG